MDNSIAISVPVIVAAILGMAVWYFKRAQEKADEAREKRLGNLEADVKSLQKDNANTKLELERRVTYDHFDTQMKNVRDEIRDMFHTLKEDIRTFFRGIKP